MMDHLEAARKLAQGDASLTIEEAQLCAQLAIAHVLIAWVERMDKAAEDAELEAERKERYQEYQARREMGIAL